MVSGPVAIEDEPTQELPAVGPDAGTDAPATGAVAAPLGAGPEPGSEPVADAAPDAAPDEEPAEPPKPLRTIVIGDRDGLTAPVPLRPMAPVPAAVPNKRTGRLVFGGEAPAAAGVGALGAAEDASPGDGLDLDGPALVIGPPRPEGAPSTAPLRTVVIGDADADDDEPAIDPRIKDRRRRVLRAAGLRRLRWVFVVLAVVALIVGANVTLRSPLFHVRQVLISGTTYVDPGELDPIVQALTGTAIVSVDLEDVRAQVEENVWVKSVDVTRDWPQTIHIDIQERRPVAYYPGDDGLIHLVDVDGRVLLTLEGMPTQFVEVGGVANAAQPGEDAPEALLPAIRVANDLPETLRGDVKAVRVVQEGVVLDLKAGGLIILGDVTGLRDKLVAALAVRGQCPPGSYKTLDVRVPSRPAVSPRDGCDGSLDDTN